LTSIGSTQIVIGEKRKGLKTRFQEDEMKPQIPEINKGKTDKLAYYVFCPSCDKEVYHWFMYGVKVKCGLCGGVVGRDTDVVCKMKVITEEQTPLPKFSGASE
jgi:hypothetical protein